MSKSNARHIKCHVCGSLDAVVREHEIPVAKITHRAHVDCGGHSEYRHLTLEEQKILEDTDG